MMFSDQLMYFPIESAKEKKALEAAKQTAATAAATAAAAAAAAAAARNVEDDVLVSLALAAKNALDIANDTAKRELAECKAHTATLVRLRQSLCSHCNYNKAHTATLVRLSPVYSRGNYIGMKHSELSLLIGFAMQPYS